CKVVQPAPDHAALTRRTWIRPPLLAEPGKSETLLLRELAASASSMYWSYAIKACALFCKGPRRLQVGRRRRRCGSPMAATSAVRIGAPEAWFLGRCGSRRWATPVYAMACCVVSAQRALRHPLMGSGG